jgi:hypothetical protein
LGALHSQVWALLRLSDVFGFINQEVGGPPLSPAQINWALTEAQAQGIPLSFVVRADKTIAEGTPAMDRNGHATDGQGIDHAADAFGAQVVAIYFEALAH